MSQPDRLSAAVDAQAPYKKHGPNPSAKSNAAGKVFSEVSTVLAHALFSVVPNTATGGYPAAYTIGGR